MEQHKWYRFPIDLIDADTKRQYDVLEQIPPEDAYHESWLDIREDQILVIRPYIPKDSKDNKVLGTILYTSSDSYVINVMPKDFKELFNHQPIKFPSFKSRQHDSI